MASLSNQNLVLSLSSNRTELGRLVASLSCGRIMAGHWFSLLNCFVSNIHKIQDHRRGLRSDRRVPAPGQQVPYDPRDYPARTGRASSEAASKTQPAMVSGRRFKKYARPYRGQKAVIAVIRNYCPFDPPSAASSPSL